VVIFVDVSATAAAFVGTTVHQVSLRRTVCNHRYVEVDRTPRLCTSTCFMVSLCEAFPWSTSPLHSSTYEHSKHEA